MKDQSQLSPVFLIGAGRSGTKFLRDLLGASSEVSVIPYDVGYVWRYGNEKLPHDELTPEMLNNSIKKFISETLPKLAKQNRNNTKANIMIEKSVPNTLRPSYIHSIFPEAKFIHLVRDGRAVTESAFRLWQAQPEHSYLLKKIRYLPWKNYPYAVGYIGKLLKSKISMKKQIQSWGPRYKGIDNDIKSLPLEVVCAKQWKKCIETSFSQLKDISDDKLLEVRYEDLMKDSNSIECVCDFLELDDKQKVIANYNKTVNRNNSEKWKESLSSKQLQIINEEIASLNTKLGY